MLAGYNGKMLFVDLTEKKLEEKELTEEMIRNFIGGYGIGAKVLYDMMPAGADPLGPESVMGFVTSPSNGTSAFFSARYTIVHKSPMSGGWNDANSGGFFGPELKKAGYDALFVCGISDKPVYLWINDGDVELRDATHLWGKDTKETWEELKEELNDKRVRVIAIGKSGENVSKIACPINDGHRAPGRGGGGAVMGSKKLKAIAVRGTKNVDVADPKRVVQLNKNLTSTMKVNPFFKPFGDHGSGVGTGASALSGDSPVKNWGGVGIVDYGVENAQNLASASLDKYKTKKYACAKCPMGCGAEYEVTEGRWELGKTDRPEYETSASFGSTLLCYEEDAVLKANDICNRYGMDTISAGMTIAWALECYENKILNREELDGIDLKWGDGAAIVAILQKMADGEGCGRVLANGSAYAAKKWGKGEEYLQTVSGIELPMHDPRYAPGLARTYQFDPTPGRHVKGGRGEDQMLGIQERDKYDYKNTGEEDLQRTTSTEILNTGGFCQFGSFVSLTPQTQNEYIEAITGMQFKDEDRFNAGLRILSIRHAFNLREGIKPADLKLPERSVGSPPQTIGPLTGVSVDYDLLAKNFFEAADWDLETGKPSLDLLQRLGHLDEVIEDLYGVMNK